MFKFNSLLVLFGIVSIVVFGASIDTIKSSIPSVAQSVWEIPIYQRAVDLNKGFVKEIDIVVIKNVDSKPQDEYYFLPNDGFDSIDQLSVFAGVLNDNERVEFDYTEVVPNKVFLIKLPIPVAPNSEITLKFNYIYSGQLHAVPREISMDTVQTLLYKTNKFPLSPYPISEYTLLFQGLTKGEEYTIDGVDFVTENPPALGGPDVNPDQGIVSFGPITGKIAPFTVVPLGLKYDHNRPLTKVSNLYRSIWIPASDVNRLSVEEYYELTNSGANLNSGFNRVEWMKGRFDSIRNHWALSHLEFPLSKDRNMTDYYFTDKVGVVSTHKLIDKYLVLKPRFPLFGGWKYNFTLGWTEPLDLFLHKLHNSTDEYIIRAPLLNTLRDSSYDSVYLQFYLPENSEFLEISSPIAYDSLEVDNELSYLDVSKGHVKVTIGYKNLVDDLYKLDVFVKYKYTQFDYYKKVAKISGLIFLALISYYLIGLIDLSIEKEKKTTEVVEEKKK
ncbi:Dolichyl-diphosphooligosaccharide--protein glycosyltransferase subunit 1 [Spathaspora sp. JA1]|nr:Dolichyl-diphosphooligosaccharide--protein glycosyltransferase subunit 1 [Spathaspora sp. JA1]